MPHGGQDPQGNRDHDGHEDRKRRQQQRRRELGGKGLENVTPRDIALSHVAGEHAAQPGEILLDERLVQAQFSTLGIDDLLGHCAFIPVHLRDRVTARHAHHGKGQKRDPDQYRDQLYQSLNDILSHVVLPNFAEIAKSNGEIICYPKPERKPRGGIFFRFFQKNFYKISPRGACEKCGMRDTVWRTQLQGAFYERKNDRRT